MSSDFDEEEQKLREAFYRKTGKTPEQEEYDSMAMLVTVAFLSVIGTLTIWFLSTFAW